MRFFKKCIGYLYLVVQWTVHSFDFECQREAMNVAGRKEGSMARTAPVINWSNRLSTGVSWNGLASSVL